MLKATRSWTLHGHVGNVGNVNEHAFICTSCLTHEPDQIVHLDEVTS